jgi:hypothetical protein
MRKLKKILLFAILTSCQTTYLEFSENLSNGYHYSNQREGYNGIYGGSGKIKPIDWVKKYDDDGKYISIWQADSVLMKSANFNYGHHRQNTYYPTDRFYIIDLNRDKLLGPYTKDKFFDMVSKLQISIKWKPRKIEK